MDVRNCRKCGKLFNYAMGPITCPSCMKEQEEKFQEVKSYISAHQGCGIAEVSEACEVTPQQIKHWLRDDRLEFSADSAVGLECEKCGDKIRSGRFCENCKNEMAHNLGNVYKKDEPKPQKTKDIKSSAKMRYLDR